MKLVFILSLCFISFKSFGQTPNPNKQYEEKVDLVVGIDKIMKYDFAPHTKLDIGDQSVVSTILIPNKREIVFKPLKPGNTNVTIRNKVRDVRKIYILNITETDQSKVVNELKQFLGDVEGLEIGIKANKVYVGGYIVVPDDIGKVVAVLDAYPEVLRLVELSPQTQRIIARKMQNQIQEYQMKDVTVRVVNKVYWLEGVVSSRDQVALAFKIAKAYLPDNIESLARRTGSVQTVKKEPIENFITANPKESPPEIPKLIKVSAQFVELTKDYNRLFGFKWQPLMSTGGGIQIGKGNGGLTSQSQEGTLGAFISNLFPKLTTAKNAGYARVLQSGVVITKEGTPANISKSSTQNYGVGSGEFTRSERAEATFNLSIGTTGQDGSGPTILPGEKVNLNLGINVTAFAGTPIVQENNSISTSIVVKSGSSAVVGGVVKKLTSTDFDRDPDAGAQQESDGSTQTQPLFNFLRAKSHINQKSQFAMFITPEIIESAEEGTEEIKRKFRQRRR
ncbi:MAG: hypothetical protein ACPGJV_07835 [Bacteriovoracaceae bacterium]